MVVVSGGTFKKGSSVDEVGRDPDEGPQRIVNVHSFAAGEYDVTFEQWAACVKDGGLAIG